MSLSLSAKGRNQKYFLPFRIERKKWNEMKKKMKKPQLKRREKLETKPENKSIYTLPQTLAGSTWNSKLGLSYQFENSFKNYYLLVGWFCKWLQKEREKNRVLGVKISLIWNKKSTRQLGKLPQANHGKLCLVSSLPNANRLLVGTICRCFSRWAALKLSLAIQPSTIEVKH